jgi:MOSC domain-containing protein YiiM
VNSGRVESVNVVAQVAAGYFGDTAIDKRPVAGRVPVGELGLAGDRQLSRIHGGLDKAVYAYAVEDAQWWAGELGRDIPPGQFGENLRTSGIDVTGALIGERWQIGDVVLEVRLPRTPCENLSMRMGIERFHRRFNASGRVGAMLAVLTPGTIGAGDDISVCLRPDHDVTIGCLAIGPTGAQMQRLLDSGVPLARGVRAKAKRAVERRS